MDTHEAHVALNLLEGVGPVRVRQLLEYFGEAPAILSASRSQLTHVRGIGDDTVRTVTENCNTLKFKSHHFERE